jgi:sulfate permease, SulP family
VQVQDAGLIFLSAMASSVAGYCKEKGLGDQELLVTCLVALSLATATLGFMLIIVGRLRLASVGGGKAGIVSFA